MGSFEVYVNSSRYTYFFHFFKHAVTVQATQQLTFCMSNLEITVTSTLIHGREADAPTHGIYI